MLWRDGLYGKDKRGDGLPQEPQRPSSQLDWIRKPMAEQDAAEAEASGDAKAGQRAARRARGVRKRIDAAQKLAIEIPTASGLAPFVTTPAAEMDPLAMPQRTLPTNVAGNPTPSAQRPSPTPRATSSTAVAAGFRDTTARWRSMVTTT